MGETNQDVFFFGCCISSLIVAPCVCAESFKTQLWCGRSRALRLLVLLLSRGQEEMVMVVVEEAEEVEVEEEEVEVGEEEAEEEQALQSPTL